jgi:molecular chaperone GrpE
VPDDPKKVVKIKVNDKRRSAQTPPAEADVPQESSVSSTERAPHSEQEAENEFLQDLKRVQADFENYRKRVMRDQANIADRAAARLIEQLLPVLDNFERAIAHGEGGEGVALVFKEFKDALEREGVSEIPAEGAEFDPNVHEAVDARDVDGLEVPTVVEVHRRGYALKDQLLRPAMVVVGRPRESEEGSEE